MCRIGVATTLARLPEDGLRVRRADIGTASPCVEALAQLNTQTKLVRKSAIVALSALGHVRSLYSIKVVAFIICTFSDGNNQSSGATGVSGESVDATLASLFGFGLFHTALSNRDSAGGGKSRPADGLWPVELLLRTALLSPRAINTHTVQRRRRTSFLRH